MKPYLCYIRRPHRDVSELTIIASEDDDGVPDAVRRILREWPDYQSVEVFEDERPVFRLTT